MTARARWWLVAVFLGGGLLISGMSLTVDVMRGERALDGPGLTSALLAALAYATVLFVGSALMTRFHRRRAVRSPRVALVLAVRRAVDRGRLPADADAQTWLPHLRSLDHAERRSVPLLAVMVVGVLGIGVWLTVAPGDGTPRGVGVVLLLLWVAIAVGGFVWVRRGNRVRAAFIAELETRQRAGVGS